MHNSICVLGMLATISSANPNLATEWRHNVAHNLCLASEHSGVDIRLISTYMLTENRQIDPYATKPAVVGADLGLFQLNSVYQRKRISPETAYHPYYGAYAAAQIMKENVRQFGWTWKAISAYWSPRQARQESAGAREYYRRWITNYRTVEAAFREATQSK